MSVNDSQRRTRRRRALLATWLAASIGIGAAQAGSIPWETPGEDLSSSFESGTSSMIPFAAGAGVLAASSNMYAFAGMMMPLTAGLWFAGNSTTNTAFLQGGAGGGLLTDTVFAR